MNISHPKYTNETDLRIRTLEYATTKDRKNIQFIALEPRYAHSMRRADVLVVSDSIHAYEIKSDADNLSRLSEQLEDYRHTFDFITVVTTQKHVANVLRKVGKNEGILLASGDKLESLRAARQNKKIKKINLIHMCSKDALSRQLNLAAKEHSIEFLQLLAGKKLTLEKLHKTVFEELMRRFKDQYELFLDEASIPYTENDLILLRRYDKLNISKI